MRATLVDLMERRVVGGCEAAADHVYSGHGCLSADGKLLYLCENFRANLSSPSAKKVSGRVIVRDALTLKPLREMPTHGSWVHNVMFMKKDRFLVVGMEATEGPSGSPPSGGQILFLSAADGKLLGHYLPSDPHWSLNHFDLTPDEELVVAAQTKYLLPGDGKVYRDYTAPILFGRMGETEWKKVMPEPLRDHMLRNHTVCVDRIRHRAIVAHDVGCRVSVWDLGTHDLVGMLEIENPRGLAISLDGSRYLVTSKAKNLTYVDATSLKVLNTLTGLGPKGLDGPQHITVVPNLA